MHIFKFSRYAALFFVFLLATFTASATVLTFGSHPSSTNTASDAVTSDHGTVLAIAPNDAWYGPLAGTTWISPWKSGDTDVSGFYSPPNGTVVEFYHSITLPDNFVVDSAALRFMADDTATGWLNDTNIFGPNLGQGVNCAAGAPGCLLSTMFLGSIAAGLFGPGVNTLQFDVQQRYGSSFGTDYRLEITGHETPEPATFALIGIGMIALGAKKWRERQPSQVLRR